MLHGSCDKILRGWIHENKPFRAGEGIHLRYAKIQSIFAKFWGVRCLEPGFKKKKKWAGPWEMLTEMGSMVKKKTLKRETKCRFPEGDSQPDLWWKWRNLKGVAAEGKTKENDTTTLPCVLKRKNNNAATAAAVCIFLSGALEHTILLAVNAIWFLCLMRKEMCFKYVSPWRSSLNRLKVSGIGWKK